jgi:putative salt-induced outer membrane protein
MRKTKARKMKTNPSAALGAAIGMALIATVATAQTEITGISDLDDRLDDIEEEARDDLDRSGDDYRFGNPEFREGLSGSASLSYSANEGNEDNQELTAGARLRWAQGPLVQTIGVALEFAEFEGVKTQEDIFMVYDVNYYFNDQFYGFVLGRIERNDLADEATETRTDAFLGFGPGFRVVNTPEMTWRLQAGIGVSYLENGLDESETETGYIASSRFFYQFSENVFMTNDTDILNSDSALRINNDLGVNFKVTDAFSTRISYLSEYNDSRAVKTDNKVGLTLIYSF